MYTVYHADYSKATRPILVQCEKLGYPNTDEHGATMYENTHFREEPLAYRSLMENQFAGVELAAGRIKDVEAQLAKAKEAMVKWSRMYVETRDNYREWQVQQKDAASGAAAGTTTTKEE